MPPAAAHAGLGTIPYMYGFGARGAALGQAYTALPDDASTAFFNPAAMAAMAESQIALSYLYARPEFQGGPVGDLRRFREANNPFEFNLAQKLNKLFKTDWDLALGVALALDDGGCAFIRFADSANRYGTFYRYGPASFTLSNALGWRIQPWMYMGAGVLTMLHSESTSVAQTDLNGHTAHQNITLNANVALAPIASLFFRTGPADLGVAYHGSACGIFGPINDNTVVTVGGATLAAIPMVLKYKDTFLPQRVSLGVFWRIAPWVSAAADGVWWNWGAFNKAIRRNDEPRQNLGLDFHDTYVPHLGVEFTPLPGFNVRAGYGYEQTPVSQGGSSANMILDNSKHIGGLGLGYTLRDSSVMRYPVSFDASYFLQYLVKRTAVSTDGVKYESFGALNGVIGTLTLRYQ